MAKVNITFKAKTATSTTGTISHTADLDESLADSLNRAVYLRSGDAENWVKMNLFGRVTELGIRESWTPVDVLVTKR